MKALKSCLPSSSPAAARMAPTSSATSDSRPGLPRLRSHHLSYTHQRYLDCAAYGSVRCAREGQGLARVWWGFKVWEGRMVPAQVKERSIGVGWGLAY